jgi:hypothetical protein
MSVRTAILIAIVAVIAGVLVGRYALPRGDAPAIGTGAGAGAGLEQDDPAKAASRAMIFTQPKAPAP